MGGRADPTTTVTLPASVRERLRDYQIGGKSAADAISALMDATPDHFRRDLLHALELRPRVELNDFRTQHRLPRR